MLNIIDKRVSVEENRQVALWTNEVGIYTSPALVLGMPGETSDTIGDSIRFLGSLDLGFRQYQMAYAMPIPGAPLYEYAKLSGIISDEDEYLEMISGKTTGRPYCNLTEEPDVVLMSWADRIRQEVDTGFFARKLHSRALGRLAEMVLGKLYSLRNLYKQGTLYQGLRDKCKAFIRQWQAKANIPGRKALARANADIPEMSEVFKDIDYTKSNRKVSLTEYNRRISIICRNREPA